ncbi:MAG: hypothetical protein GF353_16105 [Candidatus Lokiarchaeota archaeon]|nr:hypothetical protein [Candidatus Lokiarchaeota archaeon]
MSPAILSQAKRIANGDTDVLQNILANIFQNCTVASAKGKTLSIGEQVNFMKHRAGELRSGARNHFGNYDRKAGDVYNKHLYYQGKVEINYLHFEDDDGKGALTAFTAMKNSEDNYILKIDLENFIDTLSDRERIIFMKRLEGYQHREIADVMNLSLWTIGRKLTDIGRRFIAWFNIVEAER